jgi:hypothetical protein
MFSFLSSLTEARYKWLQSKTVVNTAPYLNQNLSTKIISDLNTKLISK